MPGLAFSTPSGVGHFVSTDFSTRSVELKTCIVPSRIKLAGRNAESSIRSREGSDARYMDQ